jgi:hypothetical protein
MAIGEAPIGNRAVRRPYDSTAIYGGTAGERLATILLPNSVAQGETRQHRTKLGFAEMPINRAYLTQGLTG